MDSPLVPTTARGLSLRVLAIVVAGVVVVTGYMVCRYLESAVPVAPLAPAEVQAAPEGLTEVLPPWRAAGAADVRGS